MKTNPRRGSARERGSAIVETALIFSIFVSMLISTVDFGQFLYIHQTLTERAREAVRYGIVNSVSDSTSIQNIVLYGQASGGSVPVTASSSDTGIFNVQRSNITVSSPGSATDDYLLMVQISGYHYTRYSPLMPGSFTGPTITAVLPLGVNF